MTSKENYADLNATKVVNKINDLTIGQDNIDLMVVQSSARFDGSITGNVGIGATTPSTKLSIYGEDDESVASRLIATFTDKIGLNEWTGIGLGGYFQTCKSGIIHERTDTYGRGSLHLCTNNAANDTNINKNDTRLTILAGGNVGIGNTSPTSQLDVNDSLTVRYKTVYNTSNDYTNWYKIGRIDSTGTSNSGQGVRFVIRLIGGSKYNTPTITNTGGVTTITGTINNGINTSGTEANIRGSFTHYGGLIVCSQVIFKAVNSEFIFDIYVLMGSDTQHGMSFETTQGATFTREFTLFGPNAPTSGGTETTAIRDAVFTHIVTGEGKVGIGSTNPSQNLEVYPDTDNSAIIGRAHIGYMGYNDYYSGFAHKDMASAGNYALLQKNDGETFLNAALNKSILFRINNQSKMNIKGNNVGIGSTNPAQKLDVVGNINFTGNLRIDDTITNTCLQTIYRPKTLTSETSSNNWVTFFDETITPKRSTSKILVMVTMGCIARIGDSFDGYHTSAELGIKLTSEISSTETTLLIPCVKVFKHWHSLELNPYYQGAGYVESAGPDFNYLHEHNTTSAITYKVQFRSETNRYGVRINTSGGNATSTMILMEYDF